MNKGQQAANNYASTMLSREDSKTKAEENDKENKPGVSGEERKGEEPVKEQPVSETGQEEVSPSGVVQEEQELTPKRETIEIESPTQTFVFEETPEQLKGITPLREGEITVGRGRKKKTIKQVVFTGRQLIDAGVGKLAGETEQVVEETGTKAKKYEKPGSGYEAAQQATNEVSKENPDASILLTSKGDDLSLTAVYVDKKKRGKGIGSKVLESVKKQADKLGKKIVLDATNELDEETDLNRLGAFYEKNGFTKVGENKFEYNPKTEAPSETANQFKEASSISKMPMRSPKRKKAVADFDAKYGEGSYKRVSKIDANFGDIISKLENSNIVTKEC
jgi:GNAT superfamily N-acetyltransferase